MGEAKQGLSRLSDWGIVLATKEHRSMRLYMMLILSSVLVAQCNPVTGPLSSGTAANITIAVHEPVPALEQAGTWIVQATVTNSSADQSFFSNVGDGYNSALDQPRIYAALGTHAFIERHIAGMKWADANTAILIEGSRFVVLGAGKTYELEGAIKPTSPGTYRVRLDYFTRNNDPTEKARQAYSATFQVK
jgi:hypothetical protein